MSFREEIGLDSRKKVKLKHELWTTEGLLQVVDVLLLLPSPRSHRGWCFVNVPCVITPVFLPSVVQNSVGGVRAHRLCVIGPAGISVGPPRAGSPH